MNAIIYGPRRGILLALVPVAWVVGLLAALAVTARWDALGGGITRVALVAIWARAISIAEPALTELVVRWWRDLVVAHGGEAEPPQPVCIAPLAAADLPLPRAERLHQERCKVMEHPGRATRWWMAGAGLALGGTTALATWARADDNVTRAALALVGFWCGAELTRLAVVGATRPGWDVRWPDSRVPGPIWLALLVFFLLGFAQAFDPQRRLDVGAGIALLVAIGAVWGVRVSWGRSPTGRRRRSTGGSHASSSPC